MTNLACHGAHQARRSASTAGLATWQTDYPGGTHAFCHASSRAHRHRLTRWLAAPSKGPAAADLRGMATARAPFAAATRGGWEARISDGSAEAGNRDRPQTAGPRAGRTSPRPDSQPQPQPRSRPQPRQGASGGGQVPRQQSPPGSAAFAGGVSTSGSDDGTNKGRSSSSSSTNDSHSSGSSDFPGASPNGRITSNPGSGFNGFSSGAAIIRSNASAGGSSRSSRTINSIVSLGGVGSIRRNGGMGSLGGVGGIGVGGAVVDVTTRLWERMVRESAEEAWRGRSRGRGRGRGGQAGPNTKGKGRRRAEEAAVDPVGTAREVFGQVVRRDAQQPGRWALQPALVEAQGRRVLPLDPFGLEAGGGGDGRGAAARDGGSGREGVGTGGGGASTGKFLHDFRDEEDDAAEWAEDGWPRYRFLVVVGPQGGGQEPQAPGELTVEAGQGPQGRQVPGLQSRAPLPPQPPPSSPSSQQSQQEQQQLQNRGPQEGSAAQEACNLGGRDTLVKRSDVPGDPQQQREQQQQQDRQQQGLQQGQRQGLPQVSTPPSAMGPQLPPRDGNGASTMDDGRSGVSLHEASAAAAADDVSSGMQAPWPATAPPPPPSSPPSRPSSSSPSPSPSVVAALGASSVVQTAAKSPAPPRQRYDYRLRLDPTKSVKLVARALVQTLSRHSVVLSEVVGPDELYHGLKALATARTVLRQQQQQQQPQPEQGSGQQSARSAQRQGQMQTDKRGGGGRRQTKQHQQQEQQQQQTSSPGVLPPQLEAADVALQLLVPKQPYIRPRLQGGRGSGGSNSGEGGETDGGEGGGGGASRVWRLYSHRVPAAAAAAVQLDPSVRLFVSRTSSAQEVAEKLGPAVVRDGQVEVLVAGRDAAVTALAAVVRTRSWLAAGGGRGADGGAGKGRRDAEGGAGGGPDEEPPSAPNAPSPSPPSQPGRQLSAAPAATSGTSHAREGFQDPSREQHLDPNLDLDVAVYASWRGGDDGEEEEEEARHESGVGRLGGGAAAAAPSRQGPQGQSQPGWQPGSQPGSQPQLLSRGLRLLVRLCRGARPDLPVLGWDELVAPVGG